MQDWISPIQYSNQNGGKKNAIQKFNEGYNVQRCAKPNY